MLRASIIVFCSGGLPVRAIRRLRDAGGTGDVEVILVGDPAGAEAALGPSARALTGETVVPRARNQGAGAARAPWFLFLDGDVVPDSGAIEAMLDARGRLAASALAALLLHPDRSVSQTGVAFAAAAQPLPLYRGFPEGHEAVHRPRDLQAASASFFLVHGEAFGRAGGFDATLGDGFADLDLCLRMRANGERIRLCPTAVGTMLRPDGPWDLGSGDGARFRMKWQGDVRADDLEHYRKDGLLRVDYRDGLPARFEVAPELGRVPDRESEAERLLDERARQFAASLRDRLELEAELDRCRRRVSDPEDLRPTPQEARISTVHEGLRRARAHLSTGRVISIVLAVRDGAAALRRSLPALVEQETDDAVEILALDYGSRDDSLEVLRHHGATVLATTPLDPATARHLAVRHARGDYVVTVEATTTPQDARWLETLVGALDRDPDLAAVTSAVRFDAHGDPLARRDAEAGAPMPLLTAAFDLAERAAARRNVPGEVMRFHLCGAAFRASTLAHVPLSPLSGWTGPAWAHEAWLDGRRVGHPPDAIVQGAVPPSLASVWLQSIEIGRSARTLFRGTFATADLLPTVFDRVHEDWLWLRTRSELGSTVLESWRLWASVRRIAELSGYWMGVNAAALPAGVLEDVSRAVLGNESPGPLADGPRFA